MGEIWKAERGLPRCQKKSVAPATKGGGGGGSKDGSSKSWDRNFFVGILLLRGCAREFEKAARDRRPYKSGLAYLLAFSERKKKFRAFQKCRSSRSGKNFFSRRILLGKASASSAFLKRETKSDSAGGLASHNR